MSRKISALTRYLRRGKPNKGNKAHQGTAQRTAQGTAQGTADLPTTKRKFQKTPQKSFKIKSPFKSPLYHPNSPSTKKFKTARTLFRESPSKQNTTAEEDEDDYREPSSDETLSGIEEDERSDGAASSTQDTGEPGRDHISRMMELIPSVMDELSKCDGKDKTFVRFFEMVSRKEFPMEHISFLLWMDVVKWFSCSSTTEMRYAETTKLFWKLGWRIFGKRFVNFMGGFKNHGDIVLNDSATGQYSPSSAEINFAVPDVRVLREYEPYAVEKNRTPGIFNDTIEKISKCIEKKSACITFDGKKIKQGLTQDSGDVDLLGFEKGDSLETRKDKLQSDLEDINSFIQLIDDCDQQAGGTFPSEKKESLKKHLAKLADHQGELEKCKVKREYNKKKLMDASGPDWKRGKYMYAISAITAYIHDVESFIETARRICDKVCRQIAFLNKEPYIDQKAVNLKKEERYVSIENELTDDTDAKNPRLITQHSEAWWKLRNQAKVTGSTLYKAIGLDGLGKQKEHFERVICGIPEKEHSEVVKEAMAWGTQNEINAVATVVGKIMPVLEPGLKFCEEGCVAVNGVDGSIFMVVSPDGSLRKSTELDTTEVAIEIKCPTRNVHIEFPDRYYLQCQAEMQTLDVERMLYISWTEQDTTVFTLERDNELLDASLELAATLYSGPSPRKPTKLSDETKRIKTEIRNRAKKVPMVGRFMSCRQDETTERNEYDLTSYACADVIDALNETSHCYIERYELLRQKATEAVVFLLADLDRSWKRDTLRCSPIAWFPKGYSLDCETMRKIAEEVHTRCTANGVHVPCESFDGQWHVLVVRDAKGEPLTMFQLQKDVWRKLEKRSKASLQAELKSMNKHVNALHIEESGNGHKHLVATNGGINLPRYRKPKEKPRHKIGDTEDVEETPTLADSLSDVVQEATGMSEDILSMSHVTDAIQLDVFTSNINDETWCEEIEELQGTVETSQLVKVPGKSPQEAKTTHVEPVTIADMRCVLSLLKTTKDANKKCIWNNVTEEELLAYFQSVKQLSTLLDSHLRVIVRYLRQTKGLTGIKEYDRKAKKIEAIASFLGLSDDIPVARERLKKQKVKTLHELAYKAVTKYSKEELNILMAEYQWPDAYQSWKMSIDDIQVNGESREWFYKPEYSNVREQTEVKCIDSTHLFTRMRRKSCRGGLDRTSNGGWLKVAKQKRTLLTPIMVEDVVDPMSVSMAKTHFSRSVENEMRRNGDFAAADLCKDIRGWWEAEDQGGISAVTRIQMREPLRRRLMSRLNCSEFPPATQYVAGWPQQLLEATIANIDAKAYLYGLVHNMTYNVRAFSSLIGETLFSELTLNDKTGTGTVTSKQFGEFIAKSTEQLQIRLDPERTFSYCTSRTKVYDIVDEANDETEIAHDSARMCNSGQGCIQKHIQTRDHAFDMQQRSRLAGRRKVDHISTDRNAVQRGALGVRWEKARTNYAKMLPTKRMGLD